MKVIFKIYNKIFLYHNVTGGVAVVTCGLCMEKAPYNFKFTVGDKHAIVNKQPENEEEKKLEEYIIKDFILQSLF